MKTIILTLLLVGGSFWAEAPPEMRTVVLQEITIEGKSYDREIFDTALEFGADSLTARILVAQARFESGDYTNRLALIHNNIFSMQDPRIRKTTSLGPLASAEGRHNTYASYESIRSAVVDLFLYFEARNIDLTQHSVSKYVYLLKKKSFFEAPTIEYRRGVWKKFKKINV